MKIIIDGDGCAVIKATESIAIKNGIECHIYCDATRLLYSDYSSIHVVTKGLDSADFAIVNNVEKGDVVITNDAGLAALILAKKGFALNSSGIEYTDRNIMSFLNRRYIYKDAKRKSKNRDNIHGHNTLCKQENHPAYKTQLCRIIHRKQKRKVVCECVTAN